MRPFTGRVFRAADELIKESFAESVWARLSNQVVASGYALSIPRDGGMDQGTMTPRTV